MEKVRRKCIVCGGGFEENPLYLCKNMPAVSQNLPVRENLQNDHPIDLRLCRCRMCGLVQFDCDPVDYYKDSTRAGERCRALIRLRREQYAHLIETYHLQGKKILEVGAGKGGFLKTLKEMSQYAVHEYGVEYNRDFVDIARSVERVNVTWGDPEDPNLLLPEAPFDAFTSFAYPARLVRPNDMLTMVRNNLKEDGVGLVMVPSLEHLLKTGGFFDIVRDHIAYYSLETLEFLFQKNGFDVLERGEVAQIYIYMYVKKRGRISLAQIWSDVDFLMEQVKSFVVEERKNQRKVAVWCAGHFAFTVLSTGELGEDIEYIIDNADFKQNHYAPGSHVRIVGPEYYKKHPVQTILILGPLYIDEILDEIHVKCATDVKIATMDKEGFRVLRKQVNDGKRCGKAGNR